MINWIKRRWRRLRRKRFDDADEVLLDAIRELEEYFEGEHEPRAVHLVRWAYAIKKGLHAWASVGAVEDFVAESQRRLEERRLHRSLTPARISAEAEARAKGSTTEVL